MTDTEATAATWSAEDNYPEARASYLLMADSEAYLAMRDTLAGLTCDGPLWFRADVAAAELARHVERTEPVRVMVGPPPEWDAAVGAYVAAYDAAARLGADPETFPDPDAPELADGPPDDARPELDAPDDTPTTVMAPVDVEPEPEPVPAGLGPGDMP